MLLSRDGKLEKVLAMIPMHFTLKKAGLQCLAQSISGIALSLRHSSILLVHQGRLMQVRNVCYKQFFVRALGTKVAERQQSLRRAASQRGPPSVQMTQGDLWSNPGVMAR